MTAQHTPGPWRQGVTLETPQTSRWTNEQIEQNDKSERCLVFARFTSLDGGRSRELVAHVFTSEHDARLIAAAPDLLAALILMVRTHDEPAESLLEEVKEQQWLQQARAAIAKATGLNKATGKETQ